MGRGHDALPKLRTDLVFSRHDGAGRIVVKDPVSGEFYAFGDAELFLAQQLDGTTSLADAGRRAEQHFGAPLAAGMLERFAADLERRGLLDGPGRARPRPPGRVRGTLLHLRIPLVDPGRLLDRLLRPTRWCFRATFVVASAFVIAAGALTLADHWAVFTADLPRLYTLGTLPVAALVLLLLISGHEVAHGLACRQFGGEVREMGVLFMYFAPALYCNVSDAWLFREKRHRLWVGAAGPYFELVLWALAVLAWRVTDPSTLVNQLALIVAAGSGVKTLFNFNPLIKLDGYYLLSDALDLPNLRTKSFRYVGDVLRGLTGWGDGPAPVPPHARRIYLTYGTLATLYSFSLLAVITLEWGDLLIAHGQPAALALLSGFVGIRLRHRVRGLLGRGGDPEDGNGAGAPAPRRSRSHRRRIRRALWLGALAALVAALFVVRMSLRISGPVTVLPAEHADVRAAVEGIVAQVAVREGERVGPGDLVAELSASGLVSERRSVEAEMAETTAGLEKLLAGPTAAEVALARAGVARAEDRLGFARTRLARFTQLFEQSAATRPELEEARELATTADNDLLEARSRLAVLLASVRPQEIEAMQARLTRLEARRRYLADQLNLLAVLSPVEGVIATPQRELRALEGQLIAKGALIARVYDYESVTAQIEIPEREMADVQVGQPVELRARAYPHVTFRGTVTAIATAAQALPSGDAPAARPGASTTFLVTTRIDNTAMRLRPGMTGQAKVFAAERRLIDILARRVSRTLNVEVWSWW